ncbi:MAG: ACT domain-containing protein, partial [Pseudomonadales bacterium]
ILAITDESLAIKLSEFREKQQQAVFAMTLPPEEQDMDYDQYLAEGRSMLERELSRLGIDDLSYDKIAQQTHFRKTDDMLAALGANDFKLARALAPFRRSIEHSEQEKPCKPRRSHRHRHPDKFSVSGVGNLLTHMANCCDPVPGDPIVGFITAGRGVTIHRQNCNNMANLDDHRRNRLVEVEWGKSDLASYPVEIRISAYHRSGLLNDITQFLKDDKTEVLMLNMETDDEQLANIRLRLEISGLKKLSRILHRLSRIPNVLEVRRVTA